ncbi:MAG: c-type cytochrome [Bauldia sp.]|nr:c-type cytochrome [Bauldia sp.]
MIQRLSALAAALAAIALGFAFSAGPAAAQQNAALVALGAQIWKDTLPCRNCHGSFGDGVQDIAQEPQGANFRISGLDPETMEMIIRCGLPGTEMPYFDGRAYTDDRCYGMTAAAAGDSIPPTGTPPMSPRQFQAVVAFIFENFVGKGPATREECLAFWGPEASTCGRFPPASEVAAPAAP